MRKRASQRIAITAAAIVAAALLAAQWTALRTRNSARRFLADFQAGRVGQPPPQTLVDLVQRYPGAVANYTRYFGKVGGACDQHNCEAAFFFENRWLRQLKLAPPVWVRAIFLVQNGVLITRNVEMGCGQGAFFLASTSERLDQLIDNEQYHVGQRRSGGPWRESVTLGPGATLEQRRAAFGFHVERLSEWGDCKDASTLLPSIPWSE